MFVKRKRKRTLCGLGLEKQMKRTRICTTAGERTESVPRQDSESDEANALEQTSVAAVSGRERALPTLNTRQIGILCLMASDRRSVADGPTRIRTQAAETTRDESGLGGKHNSDPKPKTD
jgi:hypothetical protein